MVPRALVVENESVIYQDTDGEIKLPSEYIPELVTRLAQEYARTLDLYHALRAEAERAVGRNSVLVLRAKLHGMPLSERDAWLYLATCLQAAVEQRTHIFAVTSNACFGLCQAIRDLVFGDIISPQTKDSMFRRIERLAPLSSTYLWPVSVAGHEQRAARCRKQAEDEHQ